MKLFHIGNERKERLYLILTTESILVGIIKPNTAEQKFSFEDFIKKAFLANFNDLNAIKCIDSTNSFVLEFKNKFTSKTIPIETKCYGEIKSLLMKHMSNSQNIPINAGRQLLRPIGTIITSGALVFLAYMYSVNNANTHYSVRRGLFKTAQLLAESLGPTGILLIGIPLFLLCLYTAILKLAAIEQGDIIYLKSSSTLEI